MGTRLPWIEASGVVPQRRDVALHQREGASMGFHRILSPTAALAAAVVSVGLAVAGTPAATASAGVPPGSGGIERLERQAPIWQSCGAPTPALQCASITVPLDYRRPDGATLVIAVSRIRAARQDLRRGILLMNPGGPGNSGLLLPATVGPLLPAAVRDRYDLVGFDPRGVGRSSPISCGLTPEQSNTSCCRRRASARTSAARPTWPLPARGRPDPSCRS